MDRRSIILVVVLFILIIVGMFTFAYLQKSEKEIDILTNKQEQVSEPYSEVTRIDAKHFFASGLHTFVGTIDLPTPCDLLDASATVQESFPEQILLNFQVINNSQVCPQVITTQRFLIEVQASEKAVVTATFMGRAIELNLIPPAPGETPADFELFIKG